MRRLTKWLKKCFIPHGDNDFKPHFLRRESMLFFLFLIIILELGFLIQVFVVFDKTSFLASVLPAVLTDLTNSERAANDAPPLAQNDLLTKAAQMKAEDMATNQYFAHTSPTGLTPWYWFQKVGYNFTRAGENLAVNFFESSDVARAWMNSPTHRANIIKKDYTEIGVGVASGMYQGKNTVFVAQFFGAPIQTPASTILPTQVGRKPTPAVTTPTVVALVPTITPSATQVLGEETAPVITTSPVKLFMAKILTSPRQYMNYIYGAIGLLILLSILLVLFIKSEIKHPPIMARGFALIGVIIILFIINVKILNLKTNVETTDIAANAIDAIAY